MCPGITIAGKYFTSYGICVFIGCCCVWLYEFFIWLKKKDSYTDRFLLAAIVLACMGAGAFLMQELVHLPQLIEALPLLFKDPKEFFNQAPGGFVMYGGLFGAFVGFIVYGAIFHEDMREELRISLPVFALFHAIGRIGCALSGCCYGIEVQTGGIWNETVGYYCLPVQLYESAAEIVMFVALIIVANRSSKYFMTTGIYLTFYGLLRFILEFFRGDEIRGRFLFLSTSQWISLIAVPVGIYCIFADNEKNIFGRLFDRRKKKPLNRAESNA